MSDPQSRPLNANSETTTPFFDVLSKTWIPVFAAVYGTGYVILSLYHSSLGVDETNPLRPQVTAAGVAFAALHRLGTDH